MGPHYKADRKASVQWARDLLQQEDWVILDTETTGLNADAEAVQIGVVSSSGETLFNRLLKPSIPIPPEATAIHGIRDADVVNLQNFWQVWPLLSGVLKGQLIVAYNADFDARILRQTAARHGVPLPDLSWMCAMERYAEFVGDWNDYRGNYRWQKLPRTVESPDSAHDGVGDCLATLDIIKGMAWAEL